MDEKGMEERLTAIEEKLNKISFGDNNTIVISKCEIKQVILGENNNINFEKCTIMSLRNKNGENILCDNNENNNIEVQIDDIECRFDDIECRIDELESMIDDLESNEDN